MLCTLFSVLTIALLVPERVALAHWPGQPPHQMAYLGDLQLENGGVIKNVRISYVTHGTLNAAKDNAILALHGFAANHHWAMARGEESLALEMRRRRAGSQAARDRIPPPPRATFAALRRG